MAGTVFDHNVSDEKYGERRSSVGIGSSLQILFNTGAVELQ